MLLFEHWNYYSMLLLKVRKVKRSGTDYCLSVPLSINNLARSTLNYPNCGKLPIIHQLPTKSGDRLGAKGNSGDIGKQG